MPKAMNMHVMRMISLLYFIPATTIGEGFANGLDVGLFGVDCFDIMLTNKEINPKIQ